MSEGPRQVDVAAGGLVLEPRAGGVHGVVVQRETHRTGADCRHGLELDLDVTRPGQQDPHRAGRARRPRPARPHDRVRSKRNPAQSAESAMRARCRSRWRSPRRGERERLEQPVLGHVVGQDGRLGVQLSALGCRLGTPGDAAARSVHGLARAAVDDDRPDGDVEAGPERGRRRGDQPHGAAVDPARRRLEVGDQLHGAALGSTGDRAAREECPEEVQQARARPDPRTHL